MHCTCEVCATHQASCSSTAWEPSTCQCTELWPCVIVLMYVLLVWCLTAAAAPSGPDADSRAVRTAAAIDSPGGCSCQSPGAPPAALCCGDRTHSSTCSSHGRRAGWSTAIAADHQQQPLCTAVGQAIVGTVPKRKCGFVWVSHWKPDQVSCRHSSQEVVMPLYAAVHIATGQPSAGYLQAAMVSCIAAGRYLWVQQLQHAAASTGA
jgi:hypothetical protein